MLRGLGVSMALPMLDAMVEAVSPERGTMTFQTILETMGGHDLNHLSQITALLR